MKCNCDVFIRPTLKNVNVIIYLGIGLFLYIIQIFFIRYHELKYILNILSLFILTLSFLMFLFSFLLKNFRESKENFKGKVCCFYNFLIFLTLVMYIVIVTKI